MLRDSTIISFVSSKERMIRKPQPPLIRTMQDVCVCELCAVKWSDVLIVFPSHLKITLVFGISCTLQVKILGKDNEYNRSNNH